MWIIKDKDGLYLCTVKPFKNWRTPNQFEWFCDGISFKVETNNFPNLKYTDEPVEVDVIKKL